MADIKTSCLHPARGPIKPPAEQPDSAEQPFAEEENQMIARVGKPAPDFEANAYHQGSFKTLKLSDYAGHWVVLCFYPGDFTFVCPTEITAVASRYDELQDLDVQVLSVSTDSHFSHKIWQDEELSKMVPGGVPFPMLADSGGRIGSVFGVYDDEAGVDIRGRFIIDPDGVIQAMEVMTPSVGRNVNELIRQIKGFQYTRATGEVLPAGWQPGQPTLKPGIDLAGKVWQVWTPEQFLQKA
ncbi:thioredoxin-dependent peroxiredoxin [Aggregatilinea lenta]|uniref:thioredoxin-dependent peroxiredoxin n=1 Tax=Aggregatilinea lenta TaxID=913108 RepID=UPI0023B03E2F|nr:thioredoxin-dependent peroxiredoxin [Aggregatilinea lenta]